MVEQIPQNIIRLFLSNKFNKSIDKLLNPNFGTSKPRPPTKIPLNAKLLLPYMIKNNYIKSNEEFYLMFNEYIEKGLVEYY